MHTMCDYVSKVVEGDQRVLAQEYFLPGLSQSFRSSSITIGKEVLILAGVFYFAGTFSPKRTRKTYPGLLIQRYLSKAKRDDQWRLNYWRIVNFPSWDVTYPTMKFVAITQKDIHRKSHIG